MLGMPVRSMSTHYGDGITYTAVCVAFGVRVALDTRRCTAVKSHCRLVVATIFLIVIQPGVMT